MPVLADDDKGPALTIGLVNNMPDAALQATEQQFTSLLHKASGSRAVRLRKLSLPGLPRGPQAAASMAAHYATTDTLGRNRLDGMIVTGCEPRAPALRDEPYWPALAALCDWAAAHTASTLWSCLAAHAAVLHLDGVERRRLPAKRSGVFACEPTGSHPLVEAGGEPMSVPHSRWNDLPEADLVRAGYTVLTRSPEAGVDLFVKDRGSSRFVFFQGHPEYELETVGREYRRDVARFIRGERPDYPGLPRDYFDSATETAFLAVQQRAIQGSGAGPGAVALRDLPRDPGFRPGLAEGWQATVVPVFTRWLETLDAKSRTGRQPASIAA